MTITKKELRAAMSSMKKGTPLRDAAAELGFGRGRPLRLAIQEAIGEDGYADLLATGRKAYWKDAA